MEDKGVKQLYIAKGLKKYEESVHPQGETLHDDQKVLRGKVLTPF